MLQPKPESISKPEKYFFSYDQIDALCRKSANIIKYSFEPDIILAVGGGGLIPARIMRTVINKPVFVISLSTYDENDTPIDEPRVVQWMDLSNFKDKKILIVDEVDDTRKTLDFLIDKLKNDGLIAENLGVFVIHNKHKPKLISNEDLQVSYYHAGRDVEDKWIVYPWD